jgi:hypothetical protein
MRCTFVILALALSTLVQPGCREANDQRFEVKTATAEPTPQTEHTPQRPGSIEFAGVSVSFDPKVFSARGEEILKDSPVEQDDKFEPSLRKVREIIIALRIED